MKDLMKIDYEFYNFIKQRFHIMYSKYVEKGGKRV